MSIITLLSLKNLIFQSVKVIGIYLNFSWSSKVNSYENLSQVLITIISLLLYFCCWKYFIHKYTYYSIDHIFFYYIDEAIFIKKLFKHMQYFFVYDNQYQIVTLKHKYRFLCENVYYAIGKWCGTVDMQWWVMTPYYCMLLCSV